MDFLDYVLYLARRGPPWVSSDALTPSRTLCQHPGRPASVQEAGQHEGPLKPCPSLRRPVEINTKTIHSDIMYQIKSGNGARPTQCPTNYPRDAYAHNRIYLFEAEKNKVSPTNDNECCVHRERKTRRTRSPACYPLARCQGRWNSEFFPGTDRGCVIVRRLVAHFSNVNIHSREDDFRSDNHWDYPAATTLSLSRGCVIYNCRPTATTSMQPTLATRQLNLVWSQRKEKNCKTYVEKTDRLVPCLLYTSPSPRDRQKSRMPSSA